MRSLSSTPDFSIIASSMAIWLGVMNTDSSPGSLKSVWAASRVSEANGASRSEEHTSELQSQSNLVCRLLLEKKKKNLPHMLPVRIECEHRRIIVHDLSCIAHPHYVSL